MDIDELHELPGHLLRRAHQISGAVFAAHLQGYELTPVQYAAMTAIASEPGIDATRLSDQIAFDRATIGGVIDRLEAKKYVARGPSSQDRRIKTVTLTLKGKTLLRKVESRIRKVQSEILKPLDEIERQQLVKMLEKIVAHRNRKS